MRVVLYPVSENAGLFIRRIVICMTIAISFCVVHLVWSSVFVLVPA